MDQKHRTRFIISAVTLILLCVIVNSFTACTVREGEVQDHREEIRSVPNTVQPSLWEIFKNGLSMYTSSPLKVSCYWEKTKTVLHQLHAYISPPNLEGTSSTEDQPIGASADGSGGGSAGQKMKEAVSKSFGKGKETVEETAKSAAKAVGETVQQTTEKVKRSFSDKEDKPHDHEL